LLISSRHEAELFEMGAPLTGPRNRLGIAGGPRRGFSANAELISRPPADAVDDEEAARNGSLGGNGGGETTSVV